MSYQFTQGRFKAFTSAGDLASGYKLYTYVSGTTTNKATYTDSTLGTPNTNPVVLDALGEAQVWLTTGAYTFVLKTAGDVAVWTVDGVIDPAYTGQQYTDTLRADLASTATAAVGAGLVGFSRAVSYAASTAGNKMAEVLSVQDFGASPTATAAANVAAFQSAVDSISSVGAIFVPAGSYSLNGQITIPAGKSVSFFGAGKGISILNGELAASDSTKSVLFYNGGAGTECKSVTIADLTINARFYGKGIKAVYCYPKLTIRDVNVWKPVDDGIYIEECWGASVYDVFIDGDNASVGNGIYVVNANAVSLVNPRVYNMKNTVQSRGIYATSAESFNIYGGNIENCPRGIEVTLAATFDGPAEIRGVYFEPRGMSPWTAGSPNDHIRITGDTSGRGAVTVSGCLFQSGNAGIPIAFNAVYARNLGVLMLSGNVWQKAQYTVGGQGENFFVNADDTVARVTQDGNQLISTSLGNLNTITSGVLLNVSNINDSGTNYDQVGAFQALTVKSASGVPLAAMYRDAVVGGSAGIGNIDIGAKESTTSFVAGARISALSDGAWTTSNHGTDVLFYTTANGSASLTQRLQLEAGGAVQPGADNTQNLGTASLRWKEVFAGVGAINTSDARAKQQVRPLADAEKAVAIRIKGMLRAFKFNDAVQEKGDGARWHIGVIAQELADAFAAEGLDASQYSLFCYDEWEEKPAIYDEAGNLLRAHLPAGNAYGVRYEELLAFVIGAL